MENYRIDIGVASKILGLSRLSLQCALQQGKLPVGNAWMNEGSNCYVYYVNAYQLRKYLGITKEELRERVKEWT